MEKLKSFIINFVKSSKFRTFLWQTTNGFILLVMAGLAELDWQYVPVLYGALNFTTKYINKTYLTK